MQQRRFAAEMDDHWRGGPFIMSIDVANSFAFMTLDQLLILGSIRMERRLHGRTFSGKVSWPFTVKRPLE